MVKTACSDKLHAPKGRWDDEGDGKTGTYASRGHGTGNWATFSRRSGQRRSGKSGRERWSSSNQKADPRHKSFTPEEEELVIQLHAAIGSRWPIIAQQLPGRTDNDVKVLWNSKLRKKLSAMGIDPVTHKPFSQILADYGNIGAFPKARTRFSSLSRDLKNAIMSKPDQSQRHAQASSTPDHHTSSSANTTLDLYSQLEAINLVSEASNHASTDTCTRQVSPPLTVNQEVSSFSWSDFLLEDAFLPSEPDEQENKGIVLQGGNIQGNGVANAMVIKNFEASSSSNSSSFVEAMVDSQDCDVFSQLPAAFYEEPFYY
ncbi:transcription factor MYB35-like isoform X2 [Sesamum indicum]|uniref:Transcription factor MYB35-like isoform X2 n=1 Tax=Sesamum indicum TaxID=4182 RepID=A0A6I9SW66_SESIN|nr:transcription factor MYB35-like isoform X2 [Sesamum indicum]